MVEQPYIPNKTFKTTKKHSMMNKQRENIKKINNKKIKIDH